MRKNIRFQDPKRTKEIQEDKRDYGRALTGRGLIIGAFIIIAILLSYFLVLNKYLIYKNAYVWF